MSWNEAMYTWKILSMGYKVKFCVGTSIILELIKRVPSGSVGHKLYIDNFFATCSLLDILEKRKILAAGTIWNPPLPIDEAMRKKGRGCVEQVSRHRKVIFTKLYDNTGILSIELCLNWRYRQSSALWKKGKSVYWTWQTWRRTDV